MDRRDPGLKQMNGLLILTLDLRKYETNTGKVFVFWKHSPFFRKNYTHIWRKKSMNLSSMEKCLSMR